MIKKAKFTTMKTKLLFSALLLGGIMASCSNEEIVKEQTPSTSLPTVNVTVGASFGADPVSRQAYGDDLSDWNYYWTSSDMLGACLTSSTDDKILSNTWFSSDVTEGEQVKEAVFKTSAALVTGKYLFYAPYKTDMLTGEISTALPEVQVQEGTSRKHLMDNNLFITAMLDIKNDEGAQFVKDAEIDLPLTFKSIYHTLDMQIGIESSNPSAITVEKIVVTPKSDGFTVETNTEGACLDFATIDDNTVTINADAIADQDKLQAGVKEALDKTMKAAIETNNKAERSYTLRLKDGYTYSSTDDVCRAFMLIPSCTAKTLEVKVYTNQGVYTETINLDGNDGSSAKEFNRNGVTSIAKSLKIRYAIDNANVKQIKTFDIATAEDWNDACAYVREHFSQFADDNNNWENPVFNLAKDIEIDSYPTDFKFDLEGADSGVELTVTKDFNLSKTTLGDDDVTFVVKEGTTLTFDEVLASADNLKITNYGTIVNNIKPTTEAAGAKLTFASLVNGDDEEDGKVGTINNNGVIEAAANALTNYLNGVINNAAGAKITASAADAIVNTGTINLQGEDSELSVGASNAVKNDGTIKVAAKAKISGTQAVVKSTNGGTIEIADVNNYTIATSPTDQTVKVEVASLADFKKAINAASKITDVTVTDAITTDAEVTATDKIVTVKGDLTLGNATFKVKELVADGDVTVAAKSGVTAATVTGDLTVNAGAKLTVNKEITFNAENSNTATATILGDMTVNGKAYFFNATVGEKMSPAQVANGSLTVNDVDGAVFGAGTNGVLNWGTVTQLGKGKIGPKVDNKASTSTFKGNADPSVEASNS